MPTSTGGAVVCISDNSKYELLPKVKLNIKGCKNLWINLNDCNLILSTIYRHSKSDITNFITALNTTLLELDCRPFYVLGDVNINIFCPFSSQVSNYLNMLATNSTFQVINRSTRITETSFTIIDHVLTNNVIPVHLIILGIIRTNLSDHYYLIFRLISNSYVSIKLPIYKSDMKKFTTESCIENLLHDLYLFLFQSSRNYFYKFQ